MRTNFVGKDSLVTDAFGMMTDKEFVNTLEDIIRRRGAMDKLISDSTKSEIFQQSFGHPPRILY